MSNTALQPESVTLPSGQVVQLGPKKPAGFISALDHLGHLAITEFDKVVLPFLVAEAPLVASVGGIFNPAVGPVYNMTLVGIIKLEAAAKAALAGGHTITGAQKIAALLTGVWPEVQKQLKADGVEADLSQYSFYVNQLVGVLNAFPAPTSSPAILAGPPSDHDLAALAATAASQVRVATASPQ